MRLTILAVTDTYYDYCIAGMTDEGKWIRPIPNLKDRFWKRSMLTQGTNFTASGDIWEIEGHHPAKLQYSNHMEDFIVSSRRLVERLSNSALLDFLESHCEDNIAFSNTVQAKGRSLCLVKASNFKLYVKSYDGKRSSKADLIGYSFSLINPKTIPGNYPVKDCKWHGLTMNNAPLPNQYKQVYACFGLAIPTPFNGVEYPQLIGLHTNPPVQPLASYPDY